MTKVLIIDDEAQIRRFVRAGFELHGHTVLEAADAASGLRAATLDKLDLIILDLNLPDLEGSEVLERIRSWSNVPIIVLSVQADEQEKVRLLRMGADDYVVKPFGMSELLARGEAAVRRQLKSSDKDPLVRAGPLSIDLVSRVVTLKGKRIQLTRKEYLLLYTLAMHAGLVVTHQQLIKEIWGGHAAGHIQYLRILVRKLRQKVEIDPTNPALIVSESGVGYRLERGSSGGSSGRPEIVPNGDPFHLSSAER
jgi:two-component system, OmpR family, KDP operon response regulator KdpE